MRKKNQTPQLVEFGEEIRKEEEILAKKAKGEIQEEIVLHKFSIKEKIQTVKKTIEDKLGEIFNTETYKHKDDIYIPERNMYISKEHNDHIFSSFISQIQKIHTNMKQAIKEEAEPKKIASLKREIEMIKKRYYTSIFQKTPEIEQEMQKLKQIENINPYTENVIKGYDIEEEIKDLEGKEFMYTTKTKGASYKSKIKEVRYETEKQQYVMSVEFDDEKARNKGAGAIFKYTDNKSFIDDINKRIKHILDETSEHEKGRVIQFIPHHQTKENLTQESKVG